MTTSPLLIKDGSHESLPATTQQAEGESSEDQELWDQLCS